MDPASAHFGCSHPFPTVPPIPGCNQRVRPEDQWARLRSSHNYLVHPVSPVLRHGFATPTPPSSRPFHPYNPNTTFSNTFPPDVGTQVAYMGYQDAVSRDWPVHDLNDYSPLLGLTIAGADVSGIPAEYPTNFSHYVVTPSQEEQQPHLALGQPSHTHRSCAISHDADCTSPTQVWSNPDVHGDSTCVRQWRDCPEGVCGFRYSTDPVKRHLRRVHFRFK